MTITLSNIDAQRAFGGKLIIALTWLMAAVVIAARLAIHGSIGGVLVACIGIATAALVAWRTAGNGSTGRALTGVALMAQVSMLVAAMGGHAWQIDMHMAYFAALALLVIYCDWLVIAAAAATVAVHHLGLSFLLPMAVFPNDANLGRVIVHAAILIVEAVTLIGVTMSVNAMFEAADSARRKAEDAMSAALSAQLLNTDYTAQIEAIGRSQAIIEFSTDGIVLNANDNFLRTMGYTLAEVKGNHHSLFVDPADATDPAYKQFWESLGRGEFKTGEFKRITKDGGEVWIQGSYNPIAGDNGEVLKVVKFATDVTARVRSVLEIGGALTRLAEGDLEHRLQKPLPPELDELRTDLNRAIEALQDAMLSVGHSAQSVKRGADEIRNSSESLSRRTETQASGLEKTAAALGEITANVKKTADGARQARDAVSAAKNDADRSGAIVSEAVEAMGGIESSSNQISQIIGVIDEIAFQTNLLALNAGVEAARAGDGGRGFAVVAQEVRALAQRSANAAKEIKSLISTSSQQVATGVKLVGEAGRALQRIAAQVSDINSVITEIAASANEQAIGLNQVNTTINQMDQVTKQNAAMVEETTAACHGLSDEANELTCLISRFDVGDEANVQASGRQAPQKAATQRLAASRPALKII